eukprot:CAMPEP_0113592378 /NCGR_PEP_ID=MMETSP0015_2-20120614/37801_1 /TAXON_ID=2838 /ORGANISM="Odontella" /LENGTH=666 /DNA_ID=CAMNT_0000498883 /DNA_START=46 /DNA_END=2043 /DNA_ORIENTATION=+ /assembly_acc=CAM_ASM_000160
MATSSCRDDETDDSDHMVDITNFFEGAVASLSYSEPFLCNEESFSLQDSMAALELMDPKMDCCEIPTSKTEEGIGPKQGEGIEVLGPFPTTVPPRNLPRGLYDELLTLPWDDLTLRQARIICLEAATRLESMLSGSSVAESTYTCLYAHDCVLKDMSERLAAPSSDIAQATKSAQKSVYSSTLLLVKLSESVRTVVQHADIYEEEDFTVNAYGFDFSPDINDGALRTVVESAMRELEEYLVGKESNQDVADADIIRLLLGFQLDLSEACSLMTKLSTENACSLMTKLSTKNVKDFVGRVKNIVTSGSEKIKKAKGLVLGIEKGTRPSSLKDELDVVSQSFDSFINRRLLGNAPVRKVKFQNHIGSLESLATVMEEIDWAACDLLLHGSTLGRIRRMLAHISASSVNILSRSIIVLNLYFDDLLLGQHSLSQMISQHMQQISGAPSSLVETDYGRSFLNRLGKPVYDTLKVLALNRNRQRAYADALMFREWAGLKMEAAAVDYYYKQEKDSDLQSTPFATNYVLHTTVWLMEHHLGTGVELGLFPGHHDLSVAFWYWDFLLSTQLNISTVMRKAKVERKVHDAKIIREHEEKKVAEFQPRGKKKGKKTSANSRNIPVALSTFMAPTKQDLEDNTEFMLLGLRRTLCRGIVRLIAALNQAEVLNKPSW